MKKQVSIIVLNWNGKHFLRECLESLDQQTYPDFEVLVVDNGSVDGSQDFVEKEFPHVRLVRLAENLGFSGGNNEGYRRSRGDYIVLLNNDTKVSPGWLKALMDAMDNHPEAGCVASKLLFYDKPDMLDTAGDEFFVWGTCRRRGHQFKDSEKYQKQTYVFNACAGAAMYRRTMIEEIGFLDESYFIYFEDVDLGFRAQLMGWKCIFVPEARVFHRVSATMSKTPARSLYLGKRNVTWTLLKNMPSVLFLKYGVGILAWQILSDIRWALKGYAREVLKARFDALSDWKRIAAERRKIQARRRVSTRELEKELSLGLPFTAGK